MNDIKLIIWDLDETLWQGTLADNDNIVLKSNVVARINGLLDRGIVHSICSKNDFKSAQAQLKKWGIDRLFVFPSISFEDKGLRIKKIIAQTHLQAKNVLFVDDNRFILAEAVFHNPDIQTCLIDAFMAISVDEWGKKDLNRQRLAHYQVLEKKETNKQLFLSTNPNEHEFLKTCNIVITISPVDINDSDTDRVVDLVNRANQLNFTQSRIKYDYLFTLFELKNGINLKVHVVDNLGDYGLVGYIGMVNNQLRHLVFSCRILGMRVEARVYQWLQMHFQHLRTALKRIKIKDSDINLDFIKVNYVDKPIKSIDKIKDKKILVRGPCLANAISFLLNEHYHVDEEIFSFFEYANLDFLRKNLGQPRCSWFDYTSKALEHQRYNVIINFLESDYYSGYYQVKNQRIPIASSYIYWQSLRFIEQDNQALGQHIKAMMIDGIRDLKKFNLSSRFLPWPGFEKVANYCLRLLGHRGCNLLYRLISYAVFRNYSGYLSAQQFKENLAWYVNLFPSDTQLVFINPPEKIKLPLLNQQQQLKIIDRTQTFNQIIRTLAKQHTNIKLLEMDEVLDQDDIIDSFSHLKRPGYIKLSKSLLALTDIA